MHLNYLEGKKILGGDWGPCSSTFTGSISANLDQFYEVYLTYVNRKSDSELVMSWAYDSQSLTVVPSSALYYPAYISNSPFNVTVVCLDPYIQSDLGCTIPVSPWGNGIRDTGEQWDDHNAIDVDGWSSIWMVQNGYACTGGSSTTQDVWTKLEFTVNSNQGSSTNSTSNSSSSSVSTPTSTSKPNIYEISSLNLWMGLAILIFVLAWLVFDVILGVMVGKYPSGIYVNIEHIQLLVILPIAGSYFTNNVNGLFRLMRFALLGFDFVNIKALLSIDLNFSQANETLEFLGFESESSFANILAFAFIGLLVMVIESVLYVTAKIWCRSCHWRAKCTNFRANCKNWMCLGYQIRYIMLGYIFILVSTISEINSSSSKYSWSWWLSFIIVLFLIMFLAAWFFNWFYSSNNESKPKLFDEFDKMLKNNINAKAFSLLFLLHRILFWVIILVVNQSNVQNKIIALMCIQYAYIILLILMRPYDSVKANINKIVCECSILVVIVLMYVYWLSSQWRGSTERVFIYLITLSCLTPCLTTAGKACSDIYSCNVCAGV